MRRPTNDVLQLVRNGANITVDAGAYSHEDLLQIARNLNKDTGMMTIVNSDVLPLESVLQIARNGRVHLL